MKTKLINLSLILISLIYLSIKVNAQSFQWVNNRNHSFVTNPDMTAFNSHSDSIGNTVFTDVQLYKLNYGQNIYGDIAVKKYNAAGNLISEKILSGKINVSGIQTDNFGYSYFAGSFMDTMVIDNVNKLFNTAAALI